MTPVSRANLGNDTKREHRQGFRASGVQGAPLGNFGSVTWCLAWSTEQGFEGQKAGV